MRRIYFYICAVVVLIGVASVVSARSPQEIEARAKELEQQAQGTQDLGRLQQLMQEAMTLSNDAAAMAETQGIKTLPSKPAATAEKEIERRREVINIQNAQLKNFIGARVQTDEKVPIPEAIAIEGRIIVDGGEVSAPSRGIIPMDLKYTVEEKFVGNLVIMKLYDAKRGKFTGEKEYMIDSLSTGIKVLQAGGRKCVKWSSGSPSSCVGWAVFNRSNIDSGNHYPNFYAGVVSAETEDGKVTVEANAPDLQFSSLANEATAKLGCFNAKWTMTASEWEQLLDRSEIVLTKNVERQVGPSPGCRPGSSITLKLKVKGKDCAIDVEDGEPLIDDCMGADGMAPLLRLKAMSGNSPAVAKWRIARGENKIRFTSGGETPQGPKAELRATAKSEAEDDIIVEAEVKKGGKTCIASRAFTARRPESLRKMTDGEALAAGITTFVSYKKLCETTGCIKPNMPVPGREHLDVTDGYNRQSVNEVLDQFDMPIRKDGLLWYEDRIAKVGNRKIEIEQMSEGGTLIPVNPSQPNGEKMNMVSQDYKTEAGGNVVDHLRVIYLSDSSGVPEGFDITVDQKIRIFSCPVAECVQHYMREDATHVCKEPAR